MRLGDVGGNTLGLYGGIFGKGSDTVLGHGYQGSLHHWKRVDSMEGGDTELWRPLSSPSGHFGPVEVIRIVNSVSFLRWNAFIIFLRIVGGSLRVGTSSLLVATNQLDSMPPGGEEETIRLHGMN